MRRLRNALRRVGLALDRAIDILIMHGPLELVRRTIAALLGPTVGGWLL